MKKIIRLSIFLTTIPIACLSQQTNTLPPLIDSTIAVQSFDRLIIDANINLLLVENDEPSIRISGNANFVNGFKIHTRRKTLVLKNLHSEIGITNQVIVNVNNLKNLIIDQESVIATKGILYSENLHILIRAQCALSIRNKGITRFTPDENLDIEIN